MLIKSKRHKYKEENKKSKIKRSEDEERAIFGLERVSIFDEVWKIGEKKREENCELNLITGRHKNGQNENRKAIKTMKLT